MCNVKDELQVHGSLWYTGATSMDDGDQSAVQFVHVALREEPASTASLVLHLSVKTHTQKHTHHTEFNQKQDILNTDIECLPYQPV